MNWKENEKEIIKIIRDKFYDFDVIALGGADSTVPDLQILKNNFKVSLDIKMEASQSSQFVLIKKDNIYEFSEKNKTFKTKTHSIIIDYINSKKEYLDLKKTKKIDIEDYIKRDLIIATLSQKEIEGFLIKKDNNILFIPANKVLECFDLELNFRLKKSGSRNLNNKWEDLFLRELKKKYNFFNYDYSSKTVSFKRELEKDELKIETDEQDFYFSQQDSKLKYKIKILSKTSNPTVIMSLNLKKKVDEKKYSLELLEELLENGGKK